MMEAFYDYDHCFKMWSIAVLQDRKLVKIIHCKKDDLQDYFDDVRREFGIIPRRVKKGDLNV